MRDDSGLLSDDALRLSLWLLCALGLLVAVYVSSCVDGSV